MDSFIEVADHLESVMNRLVAGAVGVIEQKLVTAAVERDHGDRHIHQIVMENKDRVKGLTIDLGRMQAEVEKAQRDWQLSITAIRHEVAEGLRDAIDEVRTAEGGARASIDTRVGAIEKKLDAVRWAALGVGIGSGLASGSMVALLSGVLS